MAAREGCSGRDINKIGAGARSLSGKALCSEAAGCEGYRATLSFSMGGRWDVASGIALKAQVDLIDRLEDSNGTFTNFQPTFEPGGGTQLFSVAATFVF